MSKIDETPIDLHRFMNGHVYFKLYLPRAFVYLKHVCTRNQPLTLRENVRRLLRILTFINLFSLLWFVLHIVQTCIGQTGGRAQIYKWYRNIVKDLLLSNTDNQNG